MFLATKSPKSCSTLLTSSPPSAWRLPLMRQGWGFLRSYAANRTVSSASLAPAFLMRLCSFCVTPAAEPLRYSRFPSSSLKDDVCRAFWSPGSKWEQQSLLWPLAKIGGELPFHSDRRTTWSEAGL